MVGSRILKRVAEDLYGTVFYCDRRKNFFLNYNNKYQCYTAGQFIALWEDINDIDLTAMVNNNSPSSDIEIINPKGTDYILVLTIAEIWHLKQLINSSLDTVAPLDVTNNAE